MSRNTYRPVPFRAGNKLLKEYTEPYEAKGGFTGIATFADYLDKNNKLVKRYFLRIKWDE